MTNSITIEAEDMWDRGFKTVRGNQAEGGRLVKLKRGEGTLGTEFEGEGGSYDIVIRAQDESDGESELVVKVDGEAVGTIRLDRNGDGGGSDNSGFSEFTLEGVDIPAGAEVTIHADKDGGEFVRIDNVTFVSSEPPAAGDRVTLLHETFDDSRGLARNDFELKHGGALTDGNDDGQLKLKKVDLSGYEGAELCFTAEVLQGGFESSGWAADFLRVELLDGDGNVIAVLDEFRGDGDTLHGSETGQTISKDAATLTYDLPGGLGDVKVRFVSDISANSEKLLIDDVKITGVVPGEGDDGAAGDEPDGGQQDDGGATPPADAERCVLTFEEFDRGEIVSGVDGVTITAIRAQDLGKANPANAAMIFDTADPTGGDDDLATDSQGNVLIVSEDFDSSDPDDNASGTPFVNGGGIFLIEFDSPVFVESLNYIEFRFGGTVEALDESGSVIETVDVADIGDNAVGTIEIGAEEVSSLRVTIQGSGAIDDLVFYKTPVDQDDDGDGEPPVTPPATPMPCEVDDAFTVAESEGAGDVDGNVLANDLDLQGGETVGAVNFLPENVGQPVAGSDGGLFTIAADGTLDFDANGEFDGLGAGETATTSVTYQLAPGSAGGNACVYSFTGPGGFEARVTVSEVGADLVFSVEVLQNGGDIGDLRGLFFDLADDSLLDGLSVSGTDVTGSDFDANKVSNLGNGANVNGLGKFDGGVEIGTPGQSGDDIQATTFTLSHESEALTLDLIKGEDIALRTTSVGPDGGARENSLKLLGTEEPAKFATVTVTVTGEVTPACTTCECVEFDVLADGTELSAGDGLGALVFDGVTFEAIRKQDIGRDGLLNDAMIFDAANPTGGDDDLFQPEKGNVLIISEDGDRSDPDDNAKGGRIVATLDEPSTVHSVDILDTETRDGATIDLFAEDGTLLASFPVPQIRDGEMQTLDFGDVENVKTVIFNFKSSGAIDKFCFTPPVTQNDTASVSGRYFCDKNENALDDGESGVANRTVELIDVGADGISGTADDSVVATTKTDDTGAYSFTELAAGDYAVRVNGAGFVTKDVDGNLSDDIDSDVDASGLTDAFSVAEGEQVTDVDAGTECYKVPAEGLIGVGLRLSLPVIAFTDNSGVTTYDATTDAFSMKAEVTQIVGEGGAPVPFVPTTLVTVDMTVDETGTVTDGTGGFNVFSDANDNGVFDAGDTLYLTGDALLLGSDGSAADTDSYDLLAEITGGEFADLFDPIVGLTWSSEFSDFDDDFTVNFSGEAKGFLGNVGIDCICVPPVVTPEEDPTTVSGRYFCDKNGNALDDDESGVEGRLVELIAVGADGTLGTADDLVAASTLTDATGAYLFEDVAEGDYAVRIKGAGFVTKDVDGNLSDSIDSDVDETGTTDVFTVLDGQQLTDIDAGTECFKVPETGLLGVGLQLELPVIAFTDNSGVTTYDATTDAFSMKAEVTQIVGEDGAAVPFVPTTLVTVDMTVDETGAVTDGTGAFNVFSDANDNGLFDDGETLYLTGDALVLGADGSAADTDSYDLFVEVTGGDFADLFDPIVGLTWSSEFSDFDDDFTVDFSGEAKGFLGDVGIDCICF